MDVRTVSPRRLEWLDGELAHWQADGVVDAATADALRSRYTASRRFSLARLLLGLGGAFVGVGVLWLVAANVDELSPTLRFAGVVAVWLGAVAGGEALAARRAGSAAVGAVRLLAALAFGAVVFQAAQSLQVPAYASSLVGVWGAGALLQAYAAAAVAPLLVGIAAGVGWYGWVVAERSGTVGGAALALLVAAVLAAAVAVAHGPGRLPRFAPPWRAASALLALAGLFLAALPVGADEPQRVPVAAWLGGLAVLAAAGGAAALADRTGRREVAAVAGIAGLSLLVLAWDPDDAPTLRALVATGAYVAAAAWFAALGVLRDADGLTRLAAGGLVVFVVVQSFAVFEPILSGAALFLVLGAVLAGGGWLVDRGRRRLVAEVTA